MTAPASPVELPQLPEPYYTADQEEWRPLSDLFDAEQMRAYGQQCYEAGVRAERERCAKVCTNWIPFSDSPVEFGRVATAIRKGE